jgi:hypothetical protein
MNKTIGIAAIALVMAGALYAAYYRSNSTKVAISPDALTQAQKALADQQAERAGKNNVDISTAYAGATKERFESFMRMSRIYRAEWKNVVKLPVPGRDIYFGILEKTYGDGKLEANPSPLLLIDGTFYAPGSYGGSVYERETTNWIWRYKELQFDQYYPLERYGRSIDREDILTYKLKEGIDSVSLKLYKDGLIESGTIIIREDIITFDPSDYVSYEPVTLSTLAEFAGQPDYDTWSESTRKLAGFVGETAEYTSWTGYKIKYPAVFNGKKVVRLHEGNTETFSVQDDMYAPDYMQLSCYQNPQTQVGPKTSEPTPIAKASRSKLIDWGVSKGYHSESFSFTGPGYYCNMYVSEAFRLDMFEISF